MSEMTVFVVRTHPDSQNPAGVDHLPTQSDMPGFRTDTRCGLRQLPVDRVFNEGNRDVGAPSAICPSCFSKPSKVALDEALDVLNRTQIRTGAFLYGQRARR